MYLAERMIMESHKPGFTLIELLVVMTIIGILAGLAIMQFSQYKRNTYNSQSLQTVRSLIPTVQMLLDDLIERGVVNPATAASTTAWGGGAYSGGAGGCTDTNNSLSQTACTMLPNLIKNNPNFFVQIHTLYRPSTGFSDSYIMAQHCQGNKVIRAGQVINSTSTQWRITELPFSASYCP